MGKAVAGEEGGATTHAHGISGDGSHNHRGWTTTTQKTYTHVEWWGYEFTQEEFVEAVASSVDHRWGIHRHQIPVSGNHNHGGQTEVQTVLPPYRGVVFCQKD